MKKPTIKSLRTKCDDLLTPIIVKMFPTCLLCGRPSEVAHHHVHKSQSTRLRYELSNLINLCHSCHYALHQNESFNASRIVAFKGIEWFKDLEMKKHEIVKANIHYYAENYERLKKILDEISG